jgi:seryl-tRNA synthetase
MAKVRMKENNYAQAMDDLNVCMHNLKLWYGDGVPSGWQYIPRSQVQALLNDYLAYENKVQKEINEINAEQAAKQNAQIQIQQQDIARQQQLQRNQPATQVHAMKAAQPTQGADASADTRSTFVTNNNGTAMQQLQSAQGATAQTTSPTVNAACVAQQRGGGNWGSCGLPPSLVANKDASKKLEKMGDEWRKKKDESDKLTEKLSKIKAEMAREPNKAAKLANEYSQISIQQVQVHNQEAQINDQMNSFIVQFEEEDKTAQQKPQQ